MGWCEIMGIRPIVRCSAAVAVTLAVVPAGCSPRAPETDDQEVSGDRGALLIAHRGASAYAPEHTIEAYELAIEQGADFIEPDLQITGDGVLIALHDLTLERTTNVRDVFPDRFREEVVDGEIVRVWPANDFTLEEVQSLDAGSWFGPRFAGARIPTLAEVIEAARGRAGLFPETKAPEVYGDRGFDMERLLLAELERHGLHLPGAERATPVIIQSFSPESLRILRHELGSELPLTLLVSGPEAADWLTPEGLARVRDFATGIGPAKNLLLRAPDVVDLAHELGLTVIPWTFRSRDPGTFGTVTAEMAYFLDELGVDGLFTDNPDRFPRARPGGS
jgi:glycerophosphoryl diester phosphodiesterase